MGYSKDILIQMMAEKFDAEIIYHKQLNESQQKNETMKQSKITSVQGNGTFKELYKFEVAFENGDVGTMFKKSSNPFVEVGDFVEYEITDSGKGKKINIKQKLNAPNHPSTSSGSKPQNRDLMIAKQSSLKLAFDVFSITGNIGNDPVELANQIMILSDIFTKYVMNENNGN